MTRGKSKEKGYKQMNIDDIKAVTNPLEPIADSLERIEKSICALNERLKAKRHDDTKYALLRFRSIQNDPSASVDDIREDGIGAHEQDNIRFIKRKNR